MLLEVRILLTLGADPDNLYKDDYGQKELEDRIANGNVCAICAEKYNDFLQYAQMIHEAQFGQAPILIQRQRRCKRGLIALALDGGGMRGLVSVNEIFLDGSTVKRLFGNMVDRQTRNMENVLLKCFPDEYTFLSCSKRLTVPALDISTTPAKLHVFRNYSVNNESLTEDTLFRDAARASSAAPTYFHPHIMDGRILVDGSFVANCPLNILFKEFDQCNRNGSTISLAAIISVGTGEPLATVRKYKSGSNITAKGKNIIHLSSLLLEQVVGHEQSGLESAKERCLAQNIPFVRLSPKGINVRIDQIDDGKLMDMIWTTLKYLTDHTAEIDTLGRILYELMGESSDCRGRSYTVL
uniref:PNPLA domain-containing protein n=1 Tax=Parascaris equorum TaxID=6256 RepID=A0A914S449_PAREQ